MLRNETNMRWVGAERASQIAADVERFVRDIIFFYERDSRLTPHEPTEKLVAEMREKARAAGVLTPHILSGCHMSQRESALALKIGLVPAPALGSQYRAEVHKRSIAKKLKRDQVVPC
jgi:hypothetical protein